MLFSAEQFTEKEQRQMFFRRLFRRVFLEDWLLKLVALAITLALWFGVTGLRTPTSKRFKEVSLNLNFANNLEVTNSPPKDVEIFVTGDKRKVDLLRGADLVVSVDLSDVKPGSQIIQLMPSNVNVELPNGVKLDEIQPDRILVQLEKVTEREVPVKPETEGNLADGYEIYSQTVLPSKVHVRGAESFVKSLDSISTEKINIEDRQESFVARQVGLNVSNPNVTVLDGIIDVAFTIGEKRSERLFTVSFKEENGTTRRASVILFGARSLLENVRNEDLQIEMTKSETGETVPRVVLPAELQDKVEIRKLKLSS
jgi:YbbR domain-containing protein